MLSDEEKKAIEKVKYICDKWYDESLEIDVKWLESLLSLCEKQSKEIEHQKEKIKTFKIEDENIYLQFGEITEKKRWKDKIKAKLEELKDGTYDAKIVLKSLLEKE